MLNSSLINCKYYVYLLQSESNPQKMYVGYTNTTPQKRLRKHNGEIKGGAKFCEHYRPWKIVMYVSGFISERTALQYEFCIHKKTKRRKKLSTIMKCMKSLLKKDKICSTAPLNKDMKLILFFSDISYLKLWNSL